MKFEEILPLLRNGQKIRMSTWSNKNYHLFTHLGGTWSSWDNKIYHIAGSHLIDGNWEVYDETISFADVKAGQSFMLHGSKYTKCLSNPVVFYALKAQEGTPKPTGLAVREGNECALFFMYEHYRVKSC